MKNKKKIYICIYNVSLCGFVVYIRDRNPVHVYEYHNNNGNADVEQTDGRITDGLSIGKTAIRPRN